MSVIEADLAIMLPAQKPERQALVDERYAGLMDALSEHAMTAVVAAGPRSYDAETHTFVNAARLDYDEDSLVRRQAVGSDVEVGLVRDLTMQKDPGASVYTDPAGPRIVSDLATNLFIADKTNILRVLPNIHPKSLVVEKANLMDGFSSLPGDTLSVRPIISVDDEKSLVLSRDEIGSADLTGSSYLLQEVIDNRWGNPDLDIKGPHRLRHISVASKIIGTMVYVPGSTPGSKDVASRFIAPEDLPDTIQRMTEALHRVLRAQPGNGMNVLAFDTVHGFDAGGAEGDYLRSVSRKPIRISWADVPITTLNFDKRQRDIGEMATRWDVAEAGMLAQLVDGR